MNYPLPIKCLIPTYKGFISINWIQPSSSLGLGIIRLVSVPESQAPQQVQFLLKQVRQDIRDVAIQANIIELVENWTVGSSRGV